MHKKSTGGKSKKNSQKNVRKSCYDDIQLFSLSKERETQRVIMYFAIGMKLGQNF